MLLTEFDQLPTGYATNKDDNSSLKLSDVRKTKLTLAQLSKLRVMSDIRKLEREQKIEDIQQQYSTAQGDTGAGMGM